jgi:MFS family permease
MRLSLNPDPFNQSAAKVLRVLNRWFPALSSRDYRVFWYGQCISLVGTWMQSFAQAWLVLELTGSAARLGLVVAAQTLPMLLFTLPAGVLADRYHKPRLVLVAQVILMISALILGGLVVSRTVCYWHILALAALSGTASSVDIPARQSMFVELVGRENLPNAIALNSTIFNLARLIGPALAGVTIAAIGTGPCFLINALSFIPVIITLGMIRGGRHPVAKAAKEDPWKSMAEAIRYILAKPAILLPILLTAAISVFILNFSVLIPVFGREDLLLGARGCGLLMSSLGVGALIAALLVAALGTRKEARGGLMLAGALAMSLFFAILGMEHRAGLAGLMLFAVGFGTIVFNTSANAIIQLGADDHIRGRVVGVYIFAFGGLSPFGSTVTGWMAGHWGAACTLTICGAIGMVSTLAVWILWNRMPLIVSNQNS